jgi:hypothetical protein
VNEGATDGGCLAIPGRIGLLDDLVGDPGQGKPAGESAQPGLVRSYQDDDVGLRGMGSLNACCVGDLGGGEATGQIRAHDDVSRGMGAGVNGSEAWLKDMHVPANVKGLAFGRRLCVPWSLALGGTHPSGNWLSNERPGKLDCSGRSPI